MNRRSFITLLTIVPLMIQTACTNLKKKKQPLPNIIFILADDLKWGDIGCYGQTKIRTPNIDRLAAEGVRFTQAYCGNAVSAPSRSCLMQGKHSGHARVRDNSFNGYRESLQPDDFTVASFLQQNGYKTGIFGKWGLSNHDQPGLPNDKGFDEFFGYLNQQHAHTFYPEFLYHNKERVYYPENGEQYKLEYYAKTSRYDENGVCHPNGIKDPGKGKYSFDEYASRSRDFIRNNSDSPFFLYLAYTIPHGQLIVPELGAYTHEDWPTPHKELAAMITRMDTETGRVLDLLDSLGIADNTLIIFASDNGNPGGRESSVEHNGQEFPSLTEFFHSASPTRGGKGDTYDGAFHVPALARWTGVIQPGQVSDHLWAFWDFFPTVAELIGATPPDNLDGVSFLPTLLKTGNQKEPEYLYWEYEQDQIIRSGNWLFHRSNEGINELYDLVKDPQQSVNLADNYPDLTEKFVRYAREAHTPSDVWPSPGESPEAFAERLKATGVSERKNNISNY
ncbi:MAG: arylsulfatase [Bacteroidales bacterium]|jgi:arylsulfatase A-like enzyme|nr:arylsulfatase [Bacteroidales bacterium]